MGKTVTIKGVDGADVAIVRRDDGRFVFVVENASAVVKPYAAAVVAEFIERSINNDTELVESGAADGS